MNPITNRQLVQFFAITFAVSWLLWIPAVLKSNGFPGLPDIVGLPGMFAPFGPAVAAFWLTGRQSGKAGAKALWLRRGGRRRGETEKKGGRRCTGEEKKGGDDE